MSKENQDGIVLNQDRSVEAQLQRAKEERQKKLKKQKRRKWFLFGGAGAVVLAIIIISVIISTISKNMPMTVMVTNPTRGDLESVVNVSGLIESERTINYYAPGNILVAENVQLGDKISAGENVVVFDAEDYAFRLREAELENQITNNAYQSNLANYNDVKAKLAQARADVLKYSELVVIQQSVVDEMVKEVSDANAVKVAELQSSIYSQQKDIADYTYCIQNAKELGLTQEEIQEYTTKMQASEQKINQLSYEMNQVNGGVNSYYRQKELSENQTVLAEYKAELEKAQAKVESYESALGNKYDAENIKLNGELNTMRTGQSYEELLACQDGVKAEFNGVITACNVSAGTETLAGSVMITLASLEDVKVSFSVTKSNLKDLKLGQKAVVTILDKEYDATVTRINSIATTGSNGSASIMVEVSLDKPDNDIYLGLDAKVKLTTASKTDVVMLPVEAVNADKEGEFVYLVVDGIIEKRYITLGISSDEYVEIVDGLEETDQVITMISSDLEEGMPVMAVPESTISEMGDEELEMMLEGM